MSVSILAVDASSDRCSAALWRGGVLSTRTADGKRAHSECLLPFVRDLLAESGIELAEIDALAFGAGPGGFTGIRLACSIAQGLAFGVGRPVVAVGSLDALAWAAAETRVYVCVDARMSEVYCAAYERTPSDLRAVLAPSVCAPERVPLPDDGPWVGCGSGFAAYGSAATRRLEPLVKVVVAEPGALAGSVAELAAIRLEHGAAVAATEAAPMYVREKVALTTAERLTRGGRA